MLFIVLLKVLKGVCCITFLGHAPLVVYSEGLVSLGQLALKLPGSPVCATGHFIGVLERGGVSIYYLQPYALERVVRVSFVPSDCSSSDDLLALSQRVERFAEVFNVSSKTAYIIFNSTFVKVFDDAIVIVRNEVVEVHAEPSGFTVKFKFPVNDVDVKGRVLYACTSGGLFLYDDNEFRTLFSRPCERLFVGNDSIALSYTNVAYVLKGGRLLATIKLPEPIRGIGDVNGKLYLLSGDSLYEYVVVEINDRKILVMLGVPLIVAITHLIIKLLRD